MIKETAKLGIEIPILVNAISKRVRELLRGDKALIETTHLKTYADIALKEIVEGKVVVIHVRS